MRICATAIMASLFIVSCGGSGAESEKGNAGAGDAAGKAASVEVNEAE